MEAGMAVKDYLPAEVFQEKSRRIMGLSQKLGPLRWMWHRGGDCLVTGWGAGGEVPFFSTV
ncbi:hypothetical protein TSA6c_29290 [Azospirillum sp. TSA6c]|nr:hypothetical protein TSA6c_29290 [Azospirillum sp. TSA6c]